MNNLIEVRIRPADSEINEGVRVFDWPAPDLEAAIDTIKSWGVYGLDDSLDSAHIAGFGQLVVDDGKVWFDVALEAGG